MRAKLLSSPFLLLAACAEEPPFEAVPYDAHPERPAILRDVAVIDDEVRFTQPYVPGLRTTMDGRVALRVQGGAPGTEVLRTMLSFWLFAPERLTEPLLTGPPGAEFLADPEPFNVVFPPALEPGVIRFGHHAICDPTVEFPVPGERPNPYLCGPDGRHDCYDLTVISSTSSGTSAQLWGIPVTVEVAEPKTGSARLVDVTLGEPVRGASIPTTNELLEPAVTMDGRLLTFRFGRFPRGWTNPQTGERLVRPYDLAYTVLPADAPPCDVRGWQTMHPMSHAPYDPAMVGRYGLAAYPFRDGEGDPIPDGEDLGGTYPWVDREGANVFMTGVHGRIAEQSTTRFPRRCVHEGCETYEENVDWDRGFQVAGLWTHGRFVHLDGMINNQDWAVGVTPASHWEVDLYRDAEGAAVPVRFGAGRFIDRVRDAGGPYPEGYTHNANILDSIQNLPNHHPHARPVTPRDVVWVMSTGVATAEISFDDLLDPNALIVSNMQASITQHLGEDGASTGVPYHHNGQVRVLVSHLPGFFDYPLDPEADEDIHLQNGATSLRWNVPPFGRVAAGTGRVEPVALGGVEGRGFWLSSTNTVTYEVPAQPRDVVAANQYIGLFIDPRAAANDTASRDLLTFPDGSAVRLTGHDAVQVLRDGRVERETVLPPSAGWMHLGWLVREGHRDVSVLLDGMVIDRFVTSVPVLVPVAGTLRVGAADTPARGVRGWIDDLVVLMHDVDVEVACNHARGTLVRADAPGPWADLAARYPDATHAQIAAAAGEAPSARFACFHDYTDDLAANLANVPAGTTSIRGAIHAPDGPLRAGAPRPDTTANRFCLDCHTEEGRGGLGLEALAARPDLDAEHDPRRQPLQPPRRVFGNVPAGWISPGPGPGGPATHVQAPPEGLLIDRWVLPSASP